MAWFKVDDKLWGHPKWLAVPARARGLWVTAGSWCASNETDGMVPNHVLPVLSGTRADAMALVKSGLWDETDEGFAFHEWKNFQPTRAELDERREQERQRKAEWRAQRASKKAGVPQVSQRDTAGTDAGTDAGVPGLSRLTRPDPTRPDPTPIDKNISSEVADATTDTLRADVEELLDYLDAAIRANDAKVQTRGKKARDAMRLMLDKDGRTHDQVRAAIDYATTDEFWRANILSASKLREKFDQLRLSAQRKGWRAPDRHTRQAEFWESEIEAAREMDAARFAPKEIEK